MSTALQLLANYYEAVIESERIYYKYTKGGQPSVKTPGEINDADNRDSMLVKETISLQRQITQSINECNLLKQENERQKQIHKTQIALLESKLENARKSSAKSKELPVEKIKRSNKVHLLSPIGKTHPEGNAPEPRNLSKAMTGALKSSSVDQNGGLRHAINKNKATLFDEDTNEFAENSHDASFLSSIKEKDKLADIVLPKEDLTASSSDADDKSNGKANHLENQQITQKKRRLIKKRIQRVDTDSENS
ncbi:LAME_0H11892g1_1 [Lachancea meyersii CBS 8951]|uniref:LAME_0H11892g1_1 n=1 Tax=Lachancea meyersii CBS 8951 TaxID=1266667 RepID=A0A1G4KGI6_9SACH|nr:LAME_0H11892g1_1 [Lachancea meyersii CBS 8951]